MNELCMVAQAVNFPAASQNDKSHFHDFGVLRILFPSNYHSFGILLM